MTDHGNLDGHLDLIALLARVRAALETPGDLDAATRAALIAEVGDAEDRMAVSSLPWPIDVHVGIIDHRHGVNFYTALSLDALIHEIAVYCRDWWEEIGDDRDPHLLPDDKVIERYFNDHPHEAYTVDQVRLEPPCALPDSLGETLDRGRYCILSTVHLTAQTAAQLDKWASWPPSDRPIDIAASVYGWFVPTRPLDAERQAQLPDDLLRLMAFGRERGFQFVLLDCDGGDVGGLPVHDW